MTWWIVASVAAAVLAGAWLPQGPARGLDRLRSGGAQRMVAHGVAGRTVAVRGVAVREVAAQVPLLLFRARNAQRNRIALIGLTDALSAELRAGATPRDALWRAARDQPLFAELAAAARSPAGDAVSALRNLATEDGCVAAADLATAWRVCETSGGRLAAPVARIAGAWRDDEQVRREVTAALAGPRATAVLLAALPIAGVAMASGLGAHPIALFLRPPVAALVVVPGLLLEVAGVFWTAGIARRAATW
jgi:tight adherence protein B